MLDRLGRSRVLTLSLALAALLGLALPRATRAASVLDVQAVPYLDAAGRAAYARWLTVNLPRAVAIAPGGKIGWSGGTGGSVEEARAKVLEQCAATGATGCALYAENLDVVWPSQRWAPPPVPGPLISTWNYAFVPDPRFIWWGPQSARGAYVWGHGYRGLASDNRGAQPQSHVRPFNNAGFDVIRFDREPMADDRNRAAGWLRDGLAELRRRGYRTIIAGDQSRGAWNALQMLQTPGLADAVVAVSPAAHGQGGSTNLLAQTDDLAALLADVPTSRTRLAVVQFADDPFIGDPDRRAALFSRAAPRLGALLLIDRPDGFSGHLAGGGLDFGQRYGECLLHFALDPAPPAACPGTGAAARR